MTDQNTEASGVATSRRPRERWFVAAALAVSLLLAGGLAYHASAEPDGLERVAEDHAFDTAADHALGGSPVADYAVRRVDDDRLSVGLAGALGVLLTLALAGCAFALVRAGRTSPTAEG